MIADERMLTEDTDSRRALGNLNQSVCDESARRNTTTSVVTMSHVSAQARTFVGIDLAWKPANRTGMAVVDELGRLVASGTVRSDDEIAAWLADNASTPVVVAVDAPLIVPNETGQRVGENLIAKAYGKYGASPYPSNLGNPMFNPPRALTLAKRFNWTTNPAEHGSLEHPACIEVYPHPAMVALFGLGSVLSYKAKSGRTPEARRGQFVLLMDHLEGIGQLTLQTSERWQELRLSVKGATRQMHLEVIEDEVDAILCAHLAWLWHHRPAALEVYGSNDDGYIVAPQAPTHEPTPRLAGPASKPAVSTQGVRPLATFARDVPGRPGVIGSHQLHWQQAVRAAFDGCIMPTHSRVSVEITFRLDTNTQRARNEPDLDNLIKPTIDALEGVLGRRQGTGPRVEADDVRVARITASKEFSERAGAVIAVQELPTE